MVKFEIRAIDGAEILSYTEKSRNSALTDFIPLHGQTVTVIDNPDNDEEWQHVIFDFLSGGSTPRKAWIETKYLAKPKTTTERIELNEEVFVRGCARAELLANSDDQSFEDAVVADFLLAWATIESATDDKKFTNPGPGNLTGSQAEGPFLIAPEKWKLYLDAINKQGSFVTPDQISRPNSQIPAAAFLAKHYAVEFSKLATPDPQPEDGPVIPSYLNVLHCHFLGVEAAFHFQKLKNENQGSRLAKEALAEIETNATKANNILADRKSLFSTSDGDATVELFFTLTSNMLAPAFRLAYLKIRDHAPYLLPKHANAKDAVWMKVAEKEFKEWHTKNLKESSGEGLDKVIEYFEAVKLDTTKNLPWCGAFVGHCLENSSPSFKETIVKSGATAAKWQNWGDVRLRIFDRRKIPVGSIVVTMPMSEGTSGHVGFYFSDVPGTDKIAIMGGNQSNTITKTLHVHKNRIRQIRWLSALNLENDATDNTPVTDGVLNATNADVLTLARTLYGEARGESTKGREAVANVIINRAQANYRGGSIKSVCLSRKQFSCWNPSDPNLPKLRKKRPGQGDRVFDECFDVASRAVKAGFPYHPNDPTTKKTFHYHATYVSPDWASSGTVTLQEGGHIFYKGVA